MFSNYSNADVTLTTCKAEFLQKWVSNNLNGDVAKTTRIKEMIHKTGFSKEC